MTMVLLEKDDNGRLSVRFKYCPELVAKIKAIKGRSWHPDLKYWSAPNTGPTLELLSAVLRDEDIFIDAV